MREMGSPDFKTWWIFSALSYLRLVLIMILSVHLVHLYVSHIGKGDTQPTMRYNYNLNADRLS